VSHLHEPNEIADLRARLEAAEGLIAAARSKLQTLPASPRTLMALEAIDAAQDVLSEPANAEGIASKGGSAQAANPQKEKADAPSAEAEPRTLRGRVVLKTNIYGECLKCGEHVPLGDASHDCASPAPAPTGGGAGDDWLGTREGYSYPAAHGWQTEDDLQPDWQTLARELAEALVVLEECVDDAWDGSEQAVITAGHVLARYHEAIAQHGGEGS